MRSDTRLLSANSITGIKNADLRDIILLKGVMKLLQKNSKNCYVPNTGPIYSGIEVHLCLTSIPSA